MSKTLTVAEAWTLWWTVHVHVWNMLTHTPRATLSHFDPDESWHCHLEICLCNQKISSDGKSRLGSEWFSENIMLLNLDWTQRSSYHPKKNERFEFGLNHKDFWSWSICLKKDIHTININMWSEVMYSKSMLWLICDELPVDEWDSNEQNSMSPTVKVCETEPLTCHLQQTDS